MSFDFDIFVDALTSYALRDGALITLALARGPGGRRADRRRPGARADRPVPRVRAEGTRYLWFFRAMPPLVQLLFVWNALPQLVPALNPELVHAVHGGVLALSINEGAYMAEIIRGRPARDRRWPEQAARALGISPGGRSATSSRRSSSRDDPAAMANEFITLLKITSLASVISLRELLTGRTS